MKEETLKVVLPEGVFETKVQKYDKSDKAFLFKIYSEWRSLCKNVKKIRSRTINLPEALSESAFCVAMETVRIIEPIKGTKSSFDCYDEKRKKRIQVKGCSVIPDLTSFGPTSVWDEIYFVDFYREGKWDGTFDIYLLDNKDVYDSKVNATETFRQQQQQKRRPRFSIWSGIIEPKRLKPLKTASLKP